MKKEFAMALLLLGFRHGRKSGGSESAGQERPETTFSAVLTTR